MLPSTDFKSAASTIPPKGRVLLTGHKVIEPIIHFKEEVKSAYSFESASGFLLEDLSQ